MKLEWIFMPWWEKLTVLFQALINEIGRDFQAMMRKINTLFQALINFQESYLRPWLEKCKNAISGPNQLSVVMFSGRGWKKKKTLFQDLINLVESYIQALIEKI